MFLHGAGKTGSDADRFCSRNPGPPLGGGREGRRARVLEQPRRLLNNTQNAQDADCNRQVVASAARLRIPFLGLTGTGLDDFDGSMIAAALEDAPPRVSMEQGGLDLTQINFVGGGREGRRARVVWQPRQPGAAPALKALHCATQEQACSTRMPHPMIIGRGIGRRK